MTSEFRAFGPGEPWANGEEVLRQLIYVSTTTRRYSADEMSALLDQCRRNNKRDGITGMLLYKDGHFMQALEGEPGVLARAFDRILADERHRDAIAVLDRMGTGRDFADWSMGYRRVDVGEVPGEGFNDVLLRSADVEEGAPLAVRLLKRFAENIRE
jgi:Sensors of blue-light using FAD